MPTRLSSKTKPVTTRVPNTTIERLERVRAELERRGAKADRNAIVRVAIDETLARLEEELQLTRAA